MYYVMSSTLATPFNGRLNWSSVSSIYRNNKMSDSTSNESFLNEVEGFKVKKPIRIIKELMDDGTVVLTCRDIRVFSFGETEAEAKKELSAHISIQWDEYVDVDANQLHNSALKQKMWLTDHLEKI